MLDGSSFSISSPAVGIVHYFGGFFVLILITTTSYVVVSHYDHLLTGTNVLNLCLEVHN